MRPQVRSLRNSQASSSTQTTQAALSSPSNAPLSNCFVCPCPGRAAKCCGEIPRTGRAWPLQRPRAKLRRAISSKYRKIPIKPRLPLTLCTITTCLPTPQYVIQNGPVRLPHTHWTRGDDSPDASDEAAGRHWLPLTKCLTCRPWRPAGRSRPASFGSCSQKYDLASQ
jgi:hypothetical protein